MIKQRKTLMNCANRAVNTEPLNTYVESEPVDEVTPNNEAVLFNHEGVIRGDTQGFVELLHRMMIQISSLFTSRQTTQADC